MNRNEIKRTKIFNKYVSNLNYLKINGVISAETDKYICPICLNKHSLINTINPLTLEDAPPKSMGGKAKILTCKKCNNEAGSKIDFHLLERILEMEQRKLRPDTTINVKTKIGPNTFNAILECNKKGELSIIHNEKNNNPKTLKKQMEGLNADEIIDIQFKTRVSIDKLEIALLKTAYLKLFEYTGYALILNEYYDFIRTQIINPDLRIIPKGFWGNNIYKIKDDIYYSKQNGLELFMVVFSIKKDKFQRNIFVLLPLPHTDFSQSIRNFKFALKKGMPFKLQPVNNNKNNFFNDISLIKQFV